MNADEIRATKFECDDGLWECAKWLQEIAAQLAERNAKPNPMAALLQEYTGQMLPMLERMAGPPSPPVGSVIQNRAGQYGVVQSDGRARHRRRD